MKNRKTYRKPELKEFGCVADLTRAGVTSPPALGKVGTFPDFHASKSRRGGQPPTVPPGPP
ncbi:MAG TPA: hypothetical protein VMN36_11255 [Verrucomicrobiales bacterium]|nr:hypothetical protein [Verrucomicrobiales bacterium]